jgi:hypothetical protein
MLGTRATLAQSSWGSLAPTRVLVCCGGLCGPLGQRGRGLVAASMSMAVLLDECPVLLMLLGASTQGPGLVVSEYCACEVRCGRCAGLAWQGGCRPPNSLLDLGWGWS